MLPMRRSTIISVFVLFILITASGCELPISLPDSPPDTEVLVVTYNTHHFGVNDALFPDGDQADETLADIQWIRETLGVDVFLFQELYRSLDPNPNPFETDHVSRILDVLPGFDDLYVEETIDQDVFGKGNAVFYDTNQFECVGSSIEMILEAGGVFNSEKAAIGQILRRLSDGREVLAVCVHFDAGPFPYLRHAQVLELLPMIDDGLEERAELLSVPIHELPWIFGGDYNTAYGRNEPVIEVLEIDEGLIPTIPLRVPTFNLGFQLDHIHGLYMDVLGATVIYETTASDHFPVVGSFNLL